MRLALVSARPPQRMEASTSFAGAPLTSSHVGNAPFSDAKARAEFASVVFCESMVRTRESSTERRGLAPRLGRPCWAASTAVASSLRVAHVSARARRPASDGHWAGPAQRRRGWPRPASPTHHSSGSGRGHLGKGDGSPKLSRSSSSVALPVRASSRSGLTDGGLGSAPSSAASATGVGGSGSCFTTNSSDFRLLERLPPSPVARDRFRVMAGLANGWREQTLPHRGTNWNGSVG